MKQSIRTAFKVFTNQNRTTNHSRQPDPVHKSVVKPQGPATSLFTVKRLNEAITKAKDRFLAIQNAKGYWVFDLEADTTISSEYIFLQRFLGREISTELKEGMGHYIRRRQIENGGWPLYHAGPANISASVKSYFALKQLGDSPNAPHMVKAREFILDHGGGRLR